MNKQPQPVRRGLPSVHIHTHNPDAIAPAWLRLLIIIVGVGLGTLFLASQASEGSDPFSTMWTSTFGSAIGFNGVVLLATPLILAGAAVAVVRRVALWNIGVDGQIYLGAWMGTALAFTAPDLPGPLLTIGMLLAGCLGGAIWAGGPALLHAYFRVNEVVTTLLLNFVASSWVLYWVVEGPWANKGMQSAGSLTSKDIPDDAALAHMTLFGSVEIGFGLVIAIAVVLLVGAGLHYTRFGFESALTGADDAVARYAGIDVRRRRIMMFLLGGTLGGLAGVLLVLQVHNLSTDLSTNTGYFGIVVAVLAGKSIWGSIPMGVLMAALVALGSGLQLAGVASSSSLILTGFLLVLAASGDALARYRIRITFPERGSPHSHEAAETA